LINADALLCEYEILERISLLKLAAWKSLSVTDMLTKLHSRRIHRQDDSENNNDDRDLDMMMEWLSTGWKESKAEMRTSGKIEVIVQSILPFLGGRPRRRQPRSLAANPPSSLPTLGRNGASPPPPRATKPCAAF
jgi:hypothetical protein